MSTAEKIPALLMNEGELIDVLRESLYPGADSGSIRLVIGYCRASALDPMQKPVHIVPMWDKEAGRMRDVIMPGIGLYRTQAARSGEYGGVSEPEFGPDVTEVIEGYEITYPQWCRVTVTRLVNGHAAAFTATERWKENYAVKGGKQRSIAPNAMWARRPYGQLAKCAEAQALRKAFPEAGSAPTAEEMEGKEFVTERDVTPPRQERHEYPAESFEKNFPKWKEVIASGRKTAEQIIDMVSSKAELTEQQIKAIKDCEIAEGEYSE